MVHFQIIAVHNTTKKWKSFLMFQYSFFPDSFENLSFNVQLYLNPISRQKMVLKCNHIKTKERQQIFQLELKISYYHSLRRITNNLFRNEYYAG